MGRTRPLHIVSLIVLTGIRAARRHALRGVSNRPRGADMNELLARSWWMLALNGVAALLFGVLALLWPAITLLTLVVLFAAWAIFSGVMATVAAIRNRNADRGSWLVLLLGVVSIAAGVVAVLYPGVTALFL